MTEAEELGVTQIGPMVEGMRETQGVTGGRKTNETDMYYEIDLCSFSDSSGRKHQDSVEIVGLKILADSILAVYMVGSKNKQSSPPR